MKVEPGQKRKINYGLLLNFGLVIVSLTLFFALYKVLSGRQNYPDPVLNSFATAFAVGALGSMFFLFRPAESKGNLLLFFASTLVGLYIIEASLQTYMFFKLENIHFDSRSASMVIEDSRSKGIDLWSFEIPPSHIQQANADQGKIYALASLSNSNVITCNETGQWNTIKTDQHGFNNPPHSEAGSTSDIVLIGDSFTHGGCTPGNKSIGYYLLKHDYAIRNLGVMGSGPLHQLAVLAEYGSLYKPKIVLWLFYEGNDLGDLLNESKFEMFTRYKNLGHSSHLPEKQKAVNKFLYDYQNTKIKQMTEWRPKQDLGVFNKLLKLEAVRQKLGLMGYQIDAHLIRMNFDRVKSEFFTVAKAMNSITKSWGGKLVFVYLPDGTRYDRVQRFDYWKQDFAGIVRKLGIPIWDYHQNLNDDPDPLSSFNLRRPAHFSAKGNERLAKFLNFKLK